MANSNSKKTLGRTVNLITLRDWCMARISLHSLAGAHYDAQAITDEHMEMLKQIDTDSTLWMKIEKRI
ncbi:MAG: hypothetical protein CL681_01555 [Blastopirellula sp.]|nr:hypothetical protein [Blastopirellula sp.]MAR08644.1 hypothetical protein [Blastopirellula sp.]|tara:strand:- start:1449 stop:1652 length:204 start_codon:yes stop_codon:yes gene_type:complete